MKQTISLESAKSDKEKRHQQLSKQLISDDCVRFNMNIPRKIHRQFKAAVSSEGKEMKTVVMDTILKYIEKSK